MILLEQVVVAQVEGPLVNALVVVPTECHTDDGDATFFACFVSEELPESLLFARA